MLKCFVLKPSMCEICLISDKFKSVSYKVFYISVTVLIGFVVLDIVDSEVLLSC